MTSDEGTLVAGWYGKMPSLGDFASRRLDAAFIADWDAWLQRSLAASRQALGEAWLEVFLQSPMWRFVLMPGVCGADAWAGLLVPSVDKVGRYFPLTFALQTRIGLDVTPLFSADAWYGALEQAALLALSADCGPDDLETALAALPFPERLDNDSTIAPDWWRDPDSVPRSLTVPGPLAALVDRSAGAMLTERAAGQTFWWSVGADGSGTEIHCARGLPPETYFEVLLRGTGASDDSMVDVQVLQI